MKTDPMNDVQVVTVPVPPSQGPGSGKPAWVAFAHGRIENERTLWELIERQSAVIREHEAEIVLLRQQIATRKPRGGRDRLDDKRVAEIERDLGAGYSTRQIAARCTVSAMTVSRIAARLSARKRIA